MKFEDYFKSDVNVGLSKKRVQLKDDTSVTSCMDIISDSESYIDTVLKYIDSNDNIIDAMSVDRMSVMNLCNSYFIGFAIDDMKPRMRREFLNSCKVIISNYIRKYYHDDVMDSVMNTIDKIGDEGDLSMDMVVENAIKGLRVYRDSDLHILMFYLGMYCCSLIKNGIFKRP